MSSAALETRLIPRKLLVLSETESQVERRAHFNKARIKELAESLDANGMVNPILVRPAAKKGNPATQFEIVAGERRFMAAGLAEWPEVPCSVRELNDQQVIEVQLTENLDREELHELAEAEGYEALVSHGMNAEQIAAKFGRSPTYVLRRLRLKTLSKAVRRAFYDGKLGFTVALELAKLPIHEHQDELLEEVLDHLDHWQGPMSAADVRDHAEQHFLSELKGAPFPIAEAGLVPKAGACHGCPKRSGAQGALFEQVKGLGHCLDLVCFNAKKKAHGERMLSEAKDRGQKILRNQAEVPDSYVRLDHQPSHQGKSVKQLLDKDYQPVLVQLKTGEVALLASHKDDAKAKPKKKAKAVRK
jgi:ParB/RepB/Spo0J family partition protein